MVTSSTSGSRSAGSVPSAWVNGTKVGHRAEVPLADRAEPAHRRREPLVEQRDDHLGQFGTDAGDARGVTVGQAEHGAADHVGRGRIALGDPVVEHQAVVEPQPLGRIEQVRLALAHPRSQAVYRLAAGENVLDDRSGPAHGDERLRRQRDRLAVPGGRHDLRNSQVTSVERDRH
jgi:hypothetical protein